MKKHLLAAITLFCGSLSLSAQIPTTGLISKWSFDGNLTADSHGSYTLGNTATNLNSGYQSLANTAAYFNGGAIMGVNNSTFRRTSFSMATWLYLTETNFFHTIANVRINVSSSPYNSFNLCVGSYTGNKLTFYFTTADGNDSSLQDSTEQMIHDSTWTHVAVTCNYNGTNTAIKLYVNGVMHAQGTFLGDILYPINNPFTLGNVNGATDTNNGLFGKLDEFLYYDRAISASEVNSIYGGSSTNLEYLKNKSNQISIYPNPTSSILTIEVQEQTEITIVNVLGDVIIKQTINGLNKIDVSNLTSGVYFIQESKSGKTVKFIKK